MIFNFFFTKLRFCLITIILMFSSLSIFTIQAQTKNTHKGDVTGLPIPRFVSVKSNKVNVRRGPNATYRIDWVYTRSGVPLKVTAEYENWRRIEDFQGEGGWVHSRLLSGKRFIIVLDTEVFLKRKPNKNSPVVAVITKGVIARLVSTLGVWTEISVDGYSGWVPSSSIWGVVTKQTSSNK